MGSFNTTCFVTNQTIASDDGCVVFPIVRQKSYNKIKVYKGDKQFKEWGATSSTCYSDAFWKLKGGMITAKYYDYGRVTVEDTPENRKVILNMVAELIAEDVVVEQGENQSHDVPFNIKQFVLDKTQYLKTIITKEEFQKDESTREALFKELITVWDYVWNVAQEDRLFSLDYHNNPVPMSFAIMHQTTAQELIRLMESRKTYDKKSLKQWNVFSRAITESFTEIEEFYSKHPEHKRPGSGEWLFVERFREKLYRIGGSALHSYSDKYSDSQFDLMFRIFKEGKPTRKSFKEIKPGLDARYIIGSLEMMNLKVQPIVYSGQDYDNAMGRMYAKLVNNVSDKVYKQRRALYD